nr:unnamed protein product [Brassica oleracea]
MSSSSSDEHEERLNEAFDDIFEDTYNNIVEAQTNKQRKHAYIERNREAEHNRLWNDYFSKDPTFPAHLFRRRFRMNKELFMHIVHRLSEDVPFFRQRRDATGRFGLSPLQKCTSAIRLLVYGYAADTVDEYLRLGDSTVISCLHNFTERIIQLFGDATKTHTRGSSTTTRYWRDARVSWDGTLNDINVLDRSPVFDDIL